jgi:sugar/nucleoside kinase (ribokinase family)
VPPSTDRPVSRRQRGAGRRFLVVGDVLDAVIVQTRAPSIGDDDDAAVIRNRPAGAGGDTAAWLGWLGAEVDLVARVGVEDAYRHERALEDAGVRPHLLQEACAVTGTVVSVRNDTGRSSLTEPGASAAVDALDVPTDLVSRAHLVHLTGAGMLGGGGASRIADLVARARTGSARVSVDPSAVSVVHTIGAAAFLDAVTGADLLLPSAAEARALAGTDDVGVAAALLTEHVPLVVVTLGPQGALLARRGRAPETVQPTPATVTDTVGAGNAFAAGFLRAWATDPVRVGVAAREGTRVAARALGFVGGRPPV